MRTRRSSDAASHAPNRVADARDATKPARPSLLDGLCHLAKRRRHFLSYARRFEHLGFRTVLQDVPHRPRIIGQRMTDRERAVRSLLALLAFADPPRNPRRI